LDISSGNNVIDSTQKVPYVTFNNISEWFGTNANVPQQSYQRKFQFGMTSPRPSAVRAQTSVSIISSTQRWSGFFESNSTLESISPTTRA